MKRAEPKQEGQVPELSLVAHMSGMHSYQAKGTCPKSSGITWEHSVAYPDDLASKEILPFASTEKTLRYNLHAITFTHFTYNSIQ